jgi:hypothetical protein
MFGPCASNDTVALDVFADLEDVTVTRQGRALLVHTPVVSRLLESECLANRIRLMRQLASKRMTGSRPFAVLKRHFSKVNSRCTLV